MKQITIRCWFTNSEEFIARFVMVGKYSVKVRKIIDGTTILRKSITGEFYDIFGKEEEVDRFIKDLESKDYDIEIFE